jgi:hypothetical protein
MRNRANLVVGLFALAVAGWPGGTPSGNLLIGALGLLNLALYIWMPRL